VQLICFFLIVKGTSEYGLIWRSLELVRFPNLVGNGSALKFYPESGSAENNAYIAETFADPKHWFVEYSEIDFVSSAYIKLSDQILLVIDREGEGVEGTYRITVTRISFPPPTWHEKEQRLKTV
jgi:hypothetical protein